MNEDLKAKWDRLWHFFRVSQKFGKWDVEMKTASEKEGELIMKTKEILAEYEVFDKPESIEYVFNSLSENEKITCLHGLEVILKYMKYHAGFKTDRSDERKN